MKILLIAFCLLCTATSVWAQPQKYVRTDAKMGSPFTIVLWHADSATALHLLDEAFALVDSLAGIFSDYDSNANTARFNGSRAGEWTLCPPPLWDLVLKALPAVAASDGSFDFTVGAFTQYWRRQRRLGAFPNADTIKKLEAYTGIKNLRIDLSKNAIMKTVDELQLDFGGIAKGYIASALLNFFTNQHAPTVLINAGGDIACGNAPPHSRGWQVAVNQPQSDEVWPRNMLLHNKAVATSGDMYQGIMDQGVWYSHIVDPKTGIGTTNRRNVTVIADDAATADWLATALCILPMEKVKPLAAKYNAEWFIAVKEVDGVKSWHSLNFPRIR